MHIKPDPFPVTAEYYQFAQSEFDRLTKYRAEVLIRLQDAREKGDLSENGAYTAARFEQRNTDRSLRHFKYILLYGEVTKPSGVEKIGFGNLVTLKTDEKEIQYQLVSKHEADPKSGKISTESPLGLKLVGKKVGDSISQTTPNGEITYQVKQIE